MRREVGVVMMMACLGFAGLLGGCSSTSSDEKIAGLAAGACSGVAAGYATKGVDMGMETARRILEEKASVDAKK